MSKIIFSNSDGTLSFIVPCLNEINPTTGKPFTIQEIADKDIPAGISTYSIVEDSVIPTDIDFREGWVGVGILLCMVWFFGCGKFLVVYDVVRKLD